MPHSFTHHQPFIPFVLSFGSSFSGIRSGVRSVIHRDFRRPFAHVHGLAFPSFRSFPISFRFISFVPISLRFVVFRFALLTRAIVIQHAGRTKTLQRRTQNALRCLRPRSAHRLNAECQIANARLSVGYWALDIEYGYWILRYVPLISSYVRFRFVALGSGAMPCVCSFIRSFICAQPRMVPPHRFGVRSVLVSFRFVSSPRLPDLHPIRSPPQSTFRPVVHISRSSPRASSLWGVSAR